MPLLHAYHITAQKRYWSSTHLSAQIKTSIILPTRVGTIDIDNAVDQVGKKRWCKIVSMKVSVSSVYTVDIFSYSWIGSRFQVGLTLAFGLSMLDFNSGTGFGILMKKYTQVLQCFFDKTRI